MKRKKDKQTERQIDSDFIGPSIGWWSKKYCRVNITKHSNYPIIFLFPTTLKLYLSYFLC